MCRAGDPCIINCIGESSCAGNSQLNGTDATDVQLICDGKDACKGNTKIFCGIGDMSIECTKSTSCEDATLYCNSASSLECDGKCPDWDEFTASPTADPTEDAVTPSPITISITPKPTTAAPTPEPSPVPTDTPTFVPSPNPTESPTFVPSGNPTDSPTFVPSPEPTRAPSLVPNPDPTIDPTSDPTWNPSIDPTAEPTQAPSPVPSPSPSVEPTSAPNTGTPTTTQPTTAEPTSTPTGLPTPEPTKEPSVEPTSGPTTANPSQDPTDSPTPDPTTQPTVETTESPSSIPSKTPSASPTVPTENPTMEPTMEPSASPTSMPTVLCGQHLEGDYDSEFMELLSFNIYMESAGTLVINATRSFGEFSRSLIGIELVMPDGQVISDGDNNDIYDGNNDGFLVLGVDDLDAGVYILDFWVGTQHDRDVAIGWYDIDITCIPDDDQSLIASGARGTPRTPFFEFPRGGESEPNSYPDSNWFSLKSLYGNLTMSVSTTYVVIFWIVAVVICSVLAALFVHCSDRGYKPVAYISETETDLDFD